MDGFMALHDKKTRAFYSTVLADLSHLDSVGRQDELRKTTGLGGL